MAMGIDETVFVYTKNSGCACVCVAILLLSTRDTAKVLASQNDKLLENWCTD